ncbi:hypothetical protein GCM10023195_01570 [Actinoallomurus liliacearum]|uniref:Transposase IS4-like domain-containing protein n=1 Tax=Actinoallomurus liliacearum TaxID=1080073 RepID=A0ABP8TDQ1_9ACTN
MLSADPGAGPTTKIHLACDGHGRPLSVVLTGGNINDCTMFEQVMAGICIPRSSPHPPGTTLAAPGPGDRRQGLQLPRDPRLAAPAWHRRDHPRTT